MRLLAVVHMYPPSHNAGAELMLHSILRELVRRGHECAVLASRIATDYELDGVRVGPLTPTRGPVLTAWADVVVTHLDETASAATLAAAASKPLTHLVHNDRQLSWWGHVGDLAVFNSYWLLGRCYSEWGKRSVVCHPPVDAADYATAHPTLEQGGAVTLVNVSRAKGSDVFYGAARLLPDVPFLGVVGSYNAQEAPPWPLGNVEILPNTPDMRSVYARTAVLIVPSEYESYGRVAVEAAASGIPVVAASTPGLHEAMDAAAIFIPTLDAHRWATTLACLRDDAEAYACWSAAALRRSGELDPAEGYDAVEAALGALIV